MKEAEKETEKEAVKEPAKKDKQAEEAGQEEEKEAFVLRRKVKSTGEPAVVEHPPVILLKNKTYSTRGRAREGYAH